MSIFLGDIRVSKILFGMSCFLHPRVYLLNCISEMFKDFLPHQKNHVSDIYVSDKRGYGESVGYLHHNMV